jgi:hypothetical protein
MTSPLMDLEQIKHIFLQLNEQLHSMGRKVSVIVVGYSSLILGGQSARRTEDIDIVNNRERLFYNSGFHLLEEHFLMLHPDYKTRLHRVWPDMSQLEVFRIDYHDLFLNKFNASRAKDVLDLKFMIEQKLVQHETCLKLFEEWLQHWYNGDEQLRREFNKLWQ